MFVREGEITCLCKRKRAREHVSECVRERNGAFVCVRERVYVHDRASERVCIVFAVFPSLCNTQNVPWIAIVRHVVSSVNTYTIELDLKAPRQLEHMIKVSRAGSV